MEKHKQSIGPKKVLMYTRKKYMTEKGNFIPLFLLRVIITFGALIPAMYYQQLVDLMSKATKTDANNIANHAIALLFIVLWIKLSNTFLYRGSDFFLIRMSVNISKKIYMECFKYVQQHSYRFFTNNFAGALIKKINKNVGAIDRISDIFVFDISNIVFNGIFIIIVIGIANIYLAIILFSWIAAFIAVQYYFYKWNFQRRPKLVEHVSADMRAAR
ncbi:MAG: ABC transporter transmembrane domain-containing protein [candidate division SR1 bacterium]|nr:ABC transporter transmembrane domain-containing protein [candidate division SR1 bacterium]